MLLDANHATSRWKLIYADHRSTAMAGTRRIPRVLIAEQAAPAVVAVSVPAGCQWTV